MEGKDWGGCSWLGKHHKTKTGQIRKYLRVKRDVLDWNQRGAGILGPNIGFVGQIGLDRDCLPTRAGQ